MVENSTNGPVRTTKTVFQIIECLRELDGAGVSEVAEELDIAKSTAHRHLSTLVNQEYAIKEGDTYRIGFRFLHLGTHARKRREAYSLVEEKVRELAEVTEERAQFIVEEHGYGVFIFREFGENAVQTGTEIGKHIPLHTSASGKAILAQSSDERVEKILDRRGLNSLTENSITEKEDLLTELEEIRNRGYAINLQENVEGLHAVGVPVKDGDGNALGALSISGPTNRMQGDFIHEELPNRLRGVANELELNIKYL